MNRNLKLVIILALALILAYTITYLYFLMPSGTEVDQFNAVYDEMEQEYVPNTIFSNEDSEPFIVEFIGCFDKSHYKHYSLTIQLPDTMSFDVYVNGIMLYRIGDNQNPDTYARNHVFVVPIGDELLKEKNNTVRIVCGDYESILLYFIPTINEYDVAYRNSIFKNFILNSLFFLVISFTFLTNVILLFVRKKLNIKNKNIIVGVVTVTTLVVLSSLQYYYYPSKFLHINFIFIKKLANISTNMCILVFYRVLNLYYSKKYKTIVQDTLLILSSVSIAVVPSYEFFSYVITAHIIIVCICFVPILLRAIIGKLYEIMPVCVLFFISAIELSAGFFRLVPNLYLIHIGYAFIIVNIYILLYGHIRKVMEETIIDPLTKVYNRKHLDRFNFTEDHIVCFTDLDFFKQYNDKYGHQKGDELLAYAASRLRELKTVSGNVVRYGGDEFIIIFNGLSKSTVEDLMRSVSADISNKYGGVRMSFGAVRYDVDLNRTLKMADFAMYNMKVKTKVEVSKI